jgi:alpha-1,3-mannosyltransferase
MRVLHVSRFFHPRIGGTENHIADLTSALAAHGVTSTVLTTRRYAEGEPRPMVAVHRAASVGPDWFPIPIDVRGIRDLVRRSDLVHVHDLRFALEPVTAFALAAGVPLLLTSHGLVFHTPRLRLLKSALWRSYYRVLLGRFSVVLCVSRQDLELCRNAGLGNARLFPNPVRTAPFEAVDPRPPGNGALVYFGRLAPNKGVERLAPVLARAPADWTLTVVGRADDSYHGRVSRAMSSLGNRVLMRGEVPDDELPALVARHDCVVLPSYTEGFGLTLVEALATGVPVVASDIGPYRELSAGTGTRLVDFDRPDDVVQAVRAAVEHWNERAARAHARSYSWEARSEEFRRLYEHIAR